MRLDKAVSQVTDLSRSDVKRAAKAGRISVNGDIVTDPSSKVVETDTLCLDGEPLLEPGPRYLMLHKPRGCVSATKDSEHPTVLDLIDEPNKHKLHIAGRLDIDTTGLLLLTDDGQWSHKVTSPRHHCDKTYYAHLAERIDESAVEKFAKGIWLENEKKRTKPATLEILFANEVRVTISEGRYHQVKRMFAALGNRVLELHRERIGDIVLDETLQEGEYRPLTPEEIASVK
ncbi:16S rRNA pseudouridine(516) synthase RsuA [Microbulbifer thermotolerans]|uniref:Pseudouridine synthase n=1 Tax=Microbulbifer thermotolerans TaxID=252514 RepID=A0A143HMF5_MICTH|nr:16S rRNA pseudouridine(516) synthase RsuA [Microbulbifer thermotolerans]AMX02676.1 16S rRNA pseudouridine(516) synthase [Microbulbifer thermotolerans]MCX2780390.1 16S rRNA pseudouridine(516) synthase RsuA [Microbulbifer thermotolerans]MCX2782488.1 16S rRNA pseudouridine(516) synthase RsuA [Microbulbifer thermotolerans]MCX2794500.1 16S rRNA pseudouridine(516) synthase RsuA [Microbulbifer thermotolerans]MCX2802223.1 16S rRNA pseudouridine(516) synthase RsuA [Microbulbifer thermotolerans]